MIMLGRRRISIVLSAKMTVGLVLVGLAALLGCATTPAGRSEDGTTNVSFRNAQLPVVLGAYSKISGQTVDMAADVRRTTSFTFQFKGKATLQDVLNLIEEQLEKENVVLIPNERGGLTAVRKAQE